jgi:PAT family beta-lactamase induction signal transducer AmpG
MTNLDAPARGILVQSRRLRLFTLFILYAAQGVPIGLFWFAIPTWMATNGADAADVGYVLGLTALPWTLKLVNGFIMDRYTWLPMGRRRVWIAGAQITMIVLLICAAALAPKADDIVLLGLAGFLVNMAVTFQDVAVDGLAVDIMEEDERARASGMMFGGQAVGMALSTTLTGMAIARLGPSAAYLCAAAFIGAVTLYVLALREREGERLLPWSQGGAHARNLSIHLGAWGPIFRNTFRSMIFPASLLFLPVLLARGIHYGIFTGATPLIGTGEVGWDEESITRLVGVAQLASGIVGMTVGGWMGDLFGAKRSTIAAFSAFLVVSLMMMAGTAYWSEPSVFGAFVFAWIMLDILITVVALPISMRLCDPTVGATQFTLYMATSNFGITLGAWVLALSGQLGGLQSMFGVVFAVHTIGLLLMIFVRYPRRREFEERIHAALPEGTGPVPARN